MHKISKIVVIVLSLIGAILWFQLPDGDMPESEAIQSSSMNFMFIVTYILLGIAVLASLFFAFKNLLSTKGSLKKAGFVLAALAVIVLISWGMATGTDVSIEDMAKKDIVTSESTIRNIGMGINVFFLLLIIAVGAMLLPAIKKMFVK